MTDLSVSVVLFYKNVEEIKRLVDCVLDTSLKVKLYLIDNSSTCDFISLSEIDDRIQYVCNQANLGFGKAHNIAIKESIQQNIPYHLVLNPDIYFEKGVLERIFNYMEQNQDVGNLMPLVLYPNGEIQFLCKLLPTPADLIIRRFVPFKILTRKMDEQYELRWTGYNKIMNVPSLSGCFMFLRVNALKQVGLFDENFFLYLEDIDLNRRIHLMYKTVFYPNVKIFHKFDKASYKNHKALMIHIRSTIYYFNKWGWVFDKERKRINQDFIRNYS